LKTDDCSGNKLKTSGNSFKPPFCLIDIEQKRKMSTTRQERERAVLDLYHKQGKTVREIAKEARMSFRDIGAILNKSDESQKSSNNK
jgi:DNA-binding NarL/FixJ family response regulator